MLSTIGLNVCYLKNKNAEAYRAKLSCIFDSSNPSLVRYNNCIAIFAYLYNNNTILLNILSEKSSKTKRAALTHIAHTLSHVQSRMSVPATMF